jgi:hypothetical protein
MLEKTMSGCQKRTPHMHIDGTWISVVELKSIRVRERDEAGNVNHWVVGNPSLVLQMIDPNIGKGSDPREKQRYQYVLTEAGVLERTLPPEKYGDVWPVEPNVRAFVPCQDPSENIVTLLQHINSQAAHTEPPKH